jgi:hypothetical protein
MRALKGRGFQWQAGVNFQARPGRQYARTCGRERLQMMSIGFESISRSTLKSAHKHVTGLRLSPPWLGKVHSYGIIVFCLFMFGFDDDDTSVFKETARFN